MGSFSDSLEDFNFAIRKELERLEQAYLDEVNDLVEAAFEEGRQEGYDEGYADGCEEME